MVGDNPLTDIGGGNAVGIDTVLFKANGKSEIHSKDYRKPDYIIRKIPDVLKLLD
jgi:FMN phosphatase YigB (HAD superfamily)